MGKEAVRSKETPSRNNLTLSDVHWFSVICWPYGAINKSLVSLRKQLQRNCCLAPRLKVLRWPQLMGCKSVEESGLWFGITGATKRSKQPLVIWLLDLDLEQRNSELEGVMICHTSFPKWSRVIIWADPSLTLIVGVYSSAFWYLIVWAAYKEKCHKWFAASH